MLTKDLILKTLALHSEEFKAKYGLKRIGIFGSYAKDCADESSDIDIYAEFDVPKFHSVAGVWNELECMLDRKVDLFYPHKNMRESLYQNIQKEVIFG
jgi:uncharacterized protein